MLGNVGEKGHITIMQVQDSTHMTMFTSSTIPKGVRLGGLIMSYHLFLEISYLPFLKKKVL